MNCEACLLLRTLLTEVLLGESFSYFKDQKKNMTVMIVRLVAGGFVIKANEYHLGGSRIPE